MKKLLPILLALLLLLAGCGKQTEEAVTPEATQTEAPAEAPAAQSSGDFEGFSVSIVGAEMTVDKNGGEVLRIFYDFTNRSETACSAASVLVPDAHQDGQRLTETEAGQLSEYAGNRNLQLQKDTSIRCVLEYALVGTGTVSIELDDYDGHVVTAEFDPASLPEPEPMQEEETRTTLTLPEGMESETDLFGLYHAKLNASILNGNDLRVYIEFTNVSDAVEAAIGNYCIVFAYQDGIELELASEDNLYTAVAQGESVIVTLDYTLKDDSPVEVDLCENRERTPLAGLIVEE